MTVENTTADSASVRTEEGPSKSQQASQGARKSTFLSTHNPVGRSGIISGLVIQVTEKERDKPMRPSKANESASSAWTSVQSEAKHSEKSSKHHLLNPST